MMNIPDAILQMVGSGAAAGLISSTVGLNKDQTNRATSAAVSSLLAGLTRVASTPQGAERLAETVSRQDTGVVDNLVGALSGQGSGLAERGSGLLRSFMGGGMTSILGSVLSRFTGVAEGSTTKLLAMLTPVVFGFLSKQQESMDLNADGLANLLVGQKDNIKAAMPAGLEAALSSALPGGGQVLGGNGPTEPELAQVEGKSAASANRTADWHSRAVYSQPHRDAGKRLSVPVLLVLGALAVGILWARHQHNRQNVPPSVGAPAASPSETVTGSSSSVVPNMTRLINQASGTLAGIKDPASAEAATLRLRQINQQISGLRSSWSRLPESARSAASTALEPQIVKLKEAVQPVLNQPAIGETVRAYIDELMQNLNAFSSQ